MFLEREYPSIYLLSGLIRETKNSSLRCLDNESVRYFRENAVTHTEFTGEYWRLLLGFIEKNPIVFNLTVGKVWMVTAKSVKWKFKFGVGVAYLLVPTFCSRTPTLASISFSLSMISVS